RRWRSLLAPPFCRAPPKRAKSREEPAARQPCEFLTISRESRKAASNGGRQVSNLQRKRRNDMKRTLGLLILVLTMGLGGPAAFAQMEKKPPQKEMAPKGTMASIMDQHLSIVEREFVSAAEAMPEDKYSFAPTSGEFKGVRTFAEEVKHVASANYQFFSAVLGEKAKDDGENGPDSIKTKDDILKYLKDSFALGHRAIATITEANATTVLTNPSGEPE